MLYVARQFSKEKESDTLITLRMVPNEEICTIITESPKNDEDKAFICGEAVLDSDRIPIDGSDYLKGNYSQLPALQISPNMPDWFREEIANQAKILVHHNTPNDFIMQYRDSITGKDTRWRLIAIEIKNDKILLQFLDNEPISDQKSKFETAIIEHLAGAPIRIVAPNPHGKQEIELYRTGGDSYTSIRMHNKCIDDVTEVLRVKKESHVLTAKIPNCPATIRKYVDKLSFRRPRSVEANGQEIHIISSN